MVGTQYKSQHQMLLGLAGVNRRVKIVSLDNKGRRSGKNRRTFTYTDCFPERRSANDRRTGIHRRKKLR